MDNFSTPASDSMIFIGFSPGTPYTYDSVITELNSLSILEHLSNPFVSYENQLVYGFLGSSFTSIIFSVHILYHYCIISALLLFPIEDYARVRVCSSIKLLKNYSIRRFFLSLMS